jgi:hypothetical protein
MKKLKISATAFLWIFLTCSISFADVSVDIPPEHPIYNNIERLSSLGAFPTDFTSLRPMTVDRLQQLADQVDVSKIKNQQINSDLEQVRNYLKHENKRDSLQFNAQQGALYSNSKATPLLETDAVANPLLNQKDQSRFMQDGYQLWIQPRMYFNWDGWAAFDIEPFVGMTENPTSNDPDRNIYLRKSALKLGVRNLELLIGRSPIQWGQGFSGSLLFGGGQHPLDMIQLRNVTPVQLPSLLKIFGMAQFSGFMAKLDRNQFRPESIVIGERLAIKPHSILELAFTQSIQFMGDGAPNLSATDILSEVIGKRLQDINSVNLSNRNIAIDGSLRIPVLNQTKVYAEVFWEDCCKHPFTRDISKLFGISYPSLWQGAGVLAFEYVQTTEIYNRHRPYISGFINRGTSMGHQLGPDAEGYYAKYHHSISPSLELDLFNGYEIRGRNELNQRSTDIRIVVPTFGSPERRIRHTLKLQKNWQSKYWATLSTGYERIWNFQYVTATDRNQCMANIETGFSF